MGAVQKLTAKLGRTPTKKEVKAAKAKKAAKKAAASDAAAAAATTSFVVGPAAPTDTPLKAMEPQAESTDDGAAAVTDAESAGPVKSAAMDRAAATISARRARAMRGTGG